MNDQKHRALRYEDQGFLNKEDTKLGFSSSYCKVPGICVL